MSNYISNSLTNLLDLFSSHPHKPSVLKGDVKIEEMVEHVIDVVDPRIRVIGGYKKKLLQPLSQTWDYLTDVANLIPGGVTLSSESYSNDPRTKAVFNTKAVVQQLLDTVNPLLHENESGTKSTPTQVYMMLCMEKKESSFLGTELEGDIIKRDVLRTRVTFSNRKFLSAGYSEESAKLGFKQCALEGLLNKAHDLVMYSHDGEKELIERKRQLHQQLHSTHEQQGTEHSTLFSRNDYLMNAPPELIEIERQLREIRINAASPDHHLFQTIEVLSHPEEYVKMKAQSVVLNNLGVKLSGSEAENGINIEYAEVEIENELKRVTMIVDCSVDEIFPSKVH